MTFQKTMPLVSHILVIFLFTLFTSGGLVEAKTDTKNSAATTSVAQKKWAVIDGFRSAKFGMNKNRVKKAIAKDFKVPKNKIERLVTPLYKTTVLIKKRRRRRRFYFIF